MLNRKETFILDIACSLGFAVYASSVVIIPICLLDMARELNFHLAGGGSLKLMDSILLFLILFISGHAAAKFGKPRMLEHGTWLLTVGLILFSFSQTYWFAMFSCALIGAGSGMLEALINPLIQDTHSKNSGKALNIINGFFSFGVLSASLFIGEALTIGISWRIIFQLLAVPCAIVAILFHISKKYSLPKSSASFSNILDILKRPRFWWFGVAMIFAGAAESSFTVWSATFIRLNFIDIPRAGAIATAVFAGSMFVGRILTGSLSSKLSLRKIILFSAICGLVVSLFVPFVQTTVQFNIIIVFAGLATACFWPSIQSFAAEELPVDSTLLFIFLSCFGIPGFGLAGWILGILGDIYGLSTAFAIVPFFFFMITVAILVEQIFSIKVKALTACEK